MVLKYQAIRANQREGGGETRDERTKPTYEVLSGCHKLWTDVWHEGNMFSVQHHELRATTDTQWE